MPNTNTYCRVAGCSFYEAGDRCSAGEINVIHDGTDATCDTYLPANVNNSAISNLSAMTSSRGGYKFEVGASPVAVRREAVEQLADVSPDIGCSVNQCARNKNGNCHASAIVINSAGSPGANRCMMFVPKL